MSKIHKKRNIMYGKKWKKIRQTIAKNLICIYNTNCKKFTAVLLRIGGTKE